MLEIAQFVPTDVAVIKEVVVDDIALPCGIKKTL
jgi:hypothetical protein